MGVRRVYGAEWKHEWMLDPGIAYLNHGTVGAPPRRVIAEWRRLQDEIERQPAQFLLRELADVDGEGRPAHPHMRTAAARVARFVGCPTDAFAFVDNATTGVNAVLRSYPFGAGDEIVYANLGYGGVNNAIKFVAERSGATTRMIHLPNPGAPEDDYVAAVDEGLDDHTTMLVIDHITSQTALVLPLRRIADVCRAAGVLVLADGAHAPGAIALDVQSLGVDFYAANLHKWGFTPRSSGFLYTSPEQHDVIHPTVISWGLGHGLAAEFDLLGTRDPSAWLTSPFALDLLEEWGGADLIEHNHQMVLRQARRLAESWGTRFDTPESMIGPMAYLRLPRQLGSTKAEAVALQESLLADDRIEVPFFADEGGITCRISAQIYNDDSDFDRLRDAVLRRT